MFGKKQYNILDKIAPKKLFYLIGISTIVCLFMGILTRHYELFLIPPGILFLVLLFVDFRKVYYLLIAMIPLSIEMDMPGGLSMDMPAEPLMIILMLTFFLYFFKNPAVLHKEIYRHPIIQILLLHLVWILVAALFAEMKVIAIKFFLAKIWYITTFVFLTMAIIPNIKSFKMIYWLLILPACYGILYTLLKHAALGFDFDTINQALRPFFRNHVNYAALLSLLFPFLLLARTWYPKDSLARQVVNGSILLFLAGIFFAYTRGGWLALIGAGISVILIKRKLVKTTITVALTCIALVVGVLISNNTYLDYAPDFETTVYHGNLKDHLSATTEMKDVSGAERIYRWVAAVRMSTEHPITGFGPNNFYHHYKSYTVSDFATYVSDNPEKSGTHNYFLMLLTEQGFVGMSIFIWLTFMIFHIAIKRYHLLVDENEKNFLMAIIASMVIIYVQLMLSDLVEALKIGVFFFINLALIVSIDAKHRINKARNEN